MASLLAPGESTDCMDTKVLGGNERTTRGTVSNTCLLDQPPARSSLNARLLSLSVGQERGVSDRATKDLEATKGWSKFPEYFCLPGRALGHNFPLHCTHKSLSMPVTGDLGEHISWATKQRGEGATNWDRATKRMIKIPQALNLPGRVLGRNFTLHYTKLLLDLPGADMFG
jgi:hypothetical protein